MGGTQLMIALQVEESEASESERMDVTDEEISVQMPIAVDGLYNLVVCNECGIGIPFDWVKTHLNDHHGILTLSSAGIRPYSKINVYGRARGPSSNLTVFQNRKGP
jgi:hypothetical protein